MGDRDPDNSAPPPASDRQPSAARQPQFGWAAAEVLLVFVLFFVLAGDPPPGVNEPHYLGKAKHYWNPDWCRGDFFLDSADAHLTFYWTLGWTTRWLSLEAVAWLGRTVTWLLLAWGWTRLSHQLAPGRFWSLLTAALFAVGLRCGHMAGEWVIGGVEAKGFAYVLVLFGLAALVRGSWRTVWIWFGAASAFHILVGGWSVVAAGLAWLLAGKARPPVKQLLPGLLLGGLLSLPGLVPALALSWGADPATVREANAIYAEQRLPHHLLFHHILGQPLTLDGSYLGAEPWTVPWTHLFFLRHLLLVAVGVALWRFVRPAAHAARLYHFVAGTILIAAGGIVIDQVALLGEFNASGVLRYYWFRMSDAMVPLGVALLAAQACRQLSATRRGAGSWALIAAILLAGVNVADVIARRHLGPQIPPAFARSQVHPALDHAEQSFQQWKQVCQWIRQHTPPGEIVLTPREQQTFKWYAERGEVVSWKDVPQDAASVVRWKQRFDEVYPRHVLGHGLAAHESDELRRLAARYGFRHIVIDRRRSLRPLGWPRVFPRPDQDAAIYEVYRLPDE